MKIHQLLNENTVPDFEYRPNDYVLDQITVDDYKEADKIGDQYTNNYLNMSTIDVDDERDILFYLYMVKKFNISGTPDWERSIYQKNPNNGTDFLLLVYPGDHNVDLIVLTNRMRTIDHWVFFHHSNSRIWRNAADLYNLSQVFDDEKFLKEEHSPTLIDINWTPNDYILSQIQTTPEEFHEIRNYYDQYEDDASEIDYRDYVIKRANISSDPDWDRSIYTVRRDHVGRLILVYPGDGADLIVDQTISKYNDDHRPEAFFYFTNSQLSVDVWREWSSEVP